MKIGIDFDNTFTLDTKLFQKFINDLKIAKHEVRFVTHRDIDGENLDILHWSDELEIDIIFCNKQQKKEVCELVDWIPDVWVDDKPVKIPTSDELVLQTSRLKRKY